MHASTNSLPSTSHVSDTGHKAHACTFYQEKEEQSMQHDASCHEENTSQSYTQQTPAFRSGFVCFIGRPNVGKSTLLNTIMGTKLAITSPTAQTTRHRFRAVLTTDCFQMIMVDTPGLHKPHDVLGEHLNTSALKALEDVDCIALLLDAHQECGRGDKWVIDQLKNISVPKVLVISKADCATEEEISHQIEAARALANWDDIAVVSSFDKDSVDRFVHCVQDHLPEGPRWFPDDMKTDQAIEVIVAEFIREKILRSFRDEVPHAIGVMVEEMSFSKKKNLTSLYAIIYVERASQKGMIVGAGGSAIKRIGIEARGDLERLLGTRVFLDLRVKIKKNWRRDASCIERFGYGEGA